MSDVGVAVGVAWVWLITLHTTKKTHTVTVDVCQGHRVTGSFGLSLVV